MTPRSLRTYKYWNLLSIGIVVGAILFIPLFGNTFIQGWNWNFFDFIVAAIALFITGLLIDLSSKKIKNTTHRIAAILAILFIFFILWIEAATGGVSREISIIFNF